MNERQNIWTANGFLYDIFLTSRTRCSPGNTPLDIYYSYLDRDVDISTLCSLGAEITTFVDTCSLEGIEPYFTKWYIWWRFKDYNLFGIHIRTNYPRLMFGLLPYEYFNEVIPEYNCTFYSYPCGYTCQRDATVKNLLDAFEQTVNIVMPNG